MSVKNIEIGENCHVTKVFFYMYIKNNSDSIQNPSM